MSVDRVRELFVETYNASPELLGIAPGRVNLIGEHTDYNDGFVFPAAIDRGLYIAASPVEGFTELVSNEMGAGTSFDAANPIPGEVEGWAKYPAGVAWAYRELGHSAPNIRASVVSDVPIGSGVSSSAAIEMAFGVVWRHLIGLDLSGPKLAKLGQRAENGFVGVQSGIMDQMASACGQANRAMFLDTRTLEIRYAPLPDGVSVVLCDTQKRRALEDGSYNIRRGECEAACQILGVTKLRDTTPEVVEAHRTQLGDVVYRRAKHVTTENERCLQFAEALDQGDLAQVGALMKASHVSLRDDYEVSCAELDAMAEAAWAAPGCIGARMTGAGFGGACVALVHSDQVEAFSAATLKAYRENASFEGELMACRVVDGARLLTAA